MGKKGIPERWVEYSNMGRQIPGTRFIAFKVPLKDVYLNNLDCTVDLFGTRSVMDHIPNLGIVIDLTNTDRYYNAEDFIKNGIIYVKIKTFGHIIPGEEGFKRFCSVVERFLEENNDNDKIIGVHCTHGLNRTGYMICRYMIQHLGVAADQVIVSFNSARGYEIERENYLEDLRKGSWSISKPSHQSSFKSPQDINSPLSRSRLHADNSFLNSTPFDPPPLPVHVADFSYRRRSRSPINNNRSYDNSPYQRRHSRSIENLSQYERNSSNVPSYERRNSRNFGNASPYERRQSRSQEEFPPLIRGYSRSNDDFPQFNEGSSKFEQNGSSNYNKSYRNISNDRDTYDYKDMPKLTSSFDLPNNINFKPSFKAGKEYYKKYFGETGSSLYENDFYSRGGGGIGPHRPPPRYIPSQLGPGVRQYRGPKPYKSPPRTSEDFYDNPSTSLSTTSRIFSPDVRSPPARNVLRPVEGPSRSLFSPGTKTNVFSPENEPNARCRRYQPY